MSLRFTHYTSPPTTDAEGIKVLLWPSEALKYMTPNHRRFTQRIHLPCPLFCCCLLLLRGDQRHIKSSWKIDGGKSIQMERKPANDWVKGEPTKMGSGEREPLRACQSPRKPSCLSAHMQGSISQEARCGDGETEAECLELRDGLGCPGNRWTGGHVSFAWWGFHLPTQFATSNPFTAPIHVHKRHIEALWEEAKGKRQRQSQQTRTPHSLLHHRTFLWAACSQITTRFEDRVLFREANYKNMVWLTNGEMLPNHPKVGGQAPCHFQCVY